MLERLQDTIQDKAYRLLKAKTQRILFVYIGKVIYILQF